MCCRRNMFQNFFRWTCGKQDLFYPLPTLVESNFPFLQLSISTSSTGNRFRAAINDGYSSIFSQMTYMPIHWEFRVYSCKYLCVCDFSSPQRVRLGSFPHHFPGRPLVAHSVSDGRGRIYVNGLWYMITLQRSYWRPSPSLFPHGRLPRWRMTRHVVPRLYIADELRLSAQRSYSHRVRSNARVKFVECRCTRRLSW